MLKPKKKGGLGVLNLMLLNDALLLKQLHKFYSKRNIPWVRLTWCRYYINKVSQSQERWVPSGGKMSYA
jgi:hypothetical protein